MNDYDDILNRLSHSRFRSSFHLKPKDKQYVIDKGYDVIESHAHDFIAKRLAPAVIKNDGKQTPMKNHPVFISQHATACCCRQCLMKWHHIPSGVQLTSHQQDMIVGLIMEWIKREMR